eukprot:766586-Hanusia_phi.AAC.2
MQKDKSKMRQREVRRGEERRREENTGRRDLMEGKERKKSRAENCRDMFGCEACRHNERMQPRSLCFRLGAEQLITTYVSARTHPRHNSMCTTPHIKLRVGTSTRFRAAGTLLEKGRERDALTLVSMTLRDPSGHHST